MGNIYFRLKKFSVSRDLHRPEESKNNSNFFRKKACIFETFMV